MLVVRAILLTVALLLCTAAAGQSQEPIPSQGKAGQPEQTQSKNADDKANTSDRGTEQWPLIIRMLRSPEDKEQAEQDAKDRNVKTTLDRRLVDFTGDLAEFTRWLVVVAILQFIAMGVQAWYLYKQGRHLEKSSDLARAEFVSTQRPFVFAKGFTIGINMDGPRIKEYVFFLNWENVGNTPAMDVRSWIYSQEIPVSEKREPIFSKKDEGTPTVLGPRSAPIQSGITVPLESVVSSWNEQTRVFIWARVEYRDIFDSSVVHHHEQCARLDVIHEPSLPPPREHPPYVMPMTYGPQNSAS